MRLPRRRLRTAFVAASAMAVGLLGLAAVGTPPAGAQTGSCSAAYSVTSDWGSGFTAAITVTDSGSSAITGWTLTYTYTGNQTLTDGWSGNWSQSGETITVTNASWNGSLSAGASSSIGANFSYSGTNTAPASVTCTASGGSGGGSGSSPEIDASVSALSVTQGTTGTFTLALSAAPAADVTVSIGASGNTGLTASPTSLTYTPSDYATAQTVTVTANSSGTGATTFTVSATGYTSVTVTVTETASSSGSGAAPQLHVSGNELVNQNGGQVVLHGVDRSGTEYECVQGNGIFDGPNDQASITAIKSWGPVNAVRVPLNEACWNGESYVDSAYAGTNYIDAIKAYVSLLNSNGIVAILDLHWTDGLYTGDSSGCSSAEAVCQKPMPDSAESVPFWTSVANTFKGNDAVIFDLFNEPYPERADNSNETEGWQCWLNGGSDCVGISYQVAGMQTLVNAVRSTGANNVIMLGGLEYSNDLTQWLQYEPTDPDGNLVASWHSYNFNTCNSQSCWTSQIAPVIAKVPVIAGEIGENDCAGTYIDPLTTWLESENTSFLAWAWNADFACSSGPGLITDYTGTPTAYGAAYEAILQALP
jgi:endoglucanase